VQVRPIVVVATALSCGAVVLGALLWPPGGSVGETTTPLPVTQAPSPSPSPSPSRSPSRSSSAWPGPDNTGVPAGTTLTAYDGPCVVTEPGTRIDAAEVDCDLVVRAADVRITNSSTRRIEVGEPPASVVVEDTDVDAGEWVGAAVAHGSMTLRRVDVRGGQHSVQCEQRCLVEDSWLHEQSLPPDEPRHLNAFISNGGSDMVVRHNVLSCDEPVNDVDGGCTADLSLFGDFGPLSDVTIEDNLFRATTGGYCGSFGYNPGKEFGEDATRIVVRGNVFERGPHGRCGVYGAVTSFWVEGAGNVWEGNTWDDGRPVPP
jgi:hypothetical protein